MSCCCWYVPIGLLAVVLGLVYVYLVWNNRYWARRGVPSVAPTFAIGSFPESFWQRTNQIYDVDEAYRKYRGKVPFVGFYETRNPTLLLLDPNYIKAALTTNFKHFPDNNFIAVNTDVDPLIGRNPFLKIMYPIVQLISTKLTSFLRDELARKPAAALNAKEFTSKYTVDVVANLIYGIDSEALSERPSALLEMATGILAFNTKVLIYIFLAQLAPIVTRLWPIAIVNKKVERLFVQVTRDAIKARLESGTQRNDFLDHLLKCHQRKPMTDMEMTAHTMTFYLDGFDTTSTILTNVLMQIGGHPEVQQRVRQEINEAVAKTEKANDDDSGLSSEQLDGLQYLDQVLDETLRLMPAIGFLSRRCTEPLEMKLYDGRNVRVETPLLIPVYSMHMDEQYYPEPERFMPERFDPELGGAKRFREAGVFLPFGDGPRGCLGFRVARMILKAALVEVVRNFEITLNEKTRPKDGFSVEFLLMVKSGVWLDLKELKKEN